MILVLISVPNLQNKYVYMYDIQYIENKMPNCQFWLLVLIFTNKNFFFFITGHFEEKIMPSAGFLPYAQNLVCSFNNTCHKYEQIENRLNGYNGSM